MSGDARDTKHRTFQHERSGKASQPSPQVQEQFQQIHPGSNLPAEPASYPAEQAFWLNMAFPGAAAREEQIKQAAQAMSTPDKLPPLVGGVGHAQPDAHRDPTQQTRSDPPRQRFTAENGRRLDGFAAYRQRSADKAAPDEPARILSNWANTSLAAQRAQIAAEIAGTDDPRDLADRVRQELHLATLGMAVPGDKLEELQNELAARRPGDAGFREIVDRQSELAEVEWADQGRTHEVFDPLIAADDVGDWQELEALLTGQFAFVASAIPAAHAVEHHKLLLLTYGPQTALFQTSVSQAAGLFLVEGPQRNAAEIGKVLQGDGPVAAAAKLRDLTSHEAADPLTASEILNRSAKSIDEITGHLCAALSSGSIPLEANSGAEPFARPSPASIALMDHAQQSQVFSDLSVVADSASRSEQGLEATKHLAGLLRDAPIDMFVTASIGSGDGIVLPLEIARLRVQNSDSQGADQLALLIQRGLEDLRETARGVVRAFDETSSRLMESMKRGDAQTDVAQRGMTETGWQADPEIVAAADAQLAALNRYGYALMRMMRSLEDAGPWLDGLANYEALQRLAAAPGENESFELLFVLGAMPASLAEALRQGETNLLEAGASGNPYLRLRDLVLALQWYQDFRQFLGTVHHEGGDARRVQP